MSRMVEDREALVRRLDRVIGSQTGRLSELSAKLLAPHLGEGETLPDAGLEVELLLRRLKHLVVTLRQTYREYMNGRAALEMARKECEESAADLYEAMKRLRRTIEAARGTGTSSKLLALGGRTRRKLRALLKQAMTASSRLRGLVGTDAVAPETEAEAREWLSILEPALELRKEREDAVRRAESQVNSLLVTKDRALAAVDVAARGVVDVAVGYLRLVGEEKLAQKVRHVARRRRRPGPKKKKAPPPAATPDEA